MRSTLTDILRLVLLNDLGQLQVVGNDGRLVGGLTGKVEDGLVCSPHEQDPGTGLLVIDRTHVQWGVATGVLGIQVGRVGNQALQVLD